MASQSTISAEKISALLKIIQSDTQKTVNAMNKISNEVLLGDRKVSHAGKAFQEIMDSTKNVAVQIQEVSAVSEQMAAGAEQVAASVVEMTSITKDSLKNIKIVNENTQMQASLVEEVASLTDHLSNKADHLQQLVHKFKV